MDRFFIPSTNVIESRSGDFSVEVRGRTGLNYLEMGRCMCIDSEVLVGDPAMMVDAHSVQKWEPPHDGEPVSGADRRRIISNIREAFLFRGIRINVLREDEQH
jgi:hypothetical protein